MTENGRVTLLNTHLINNRTGTTGAGSAIFINFNGKVVMDRIADCPFLISCSKITQSQFYTSMVSNRGGTLDISRTIIDQNTINLGGPFPVGLISTDANGAITRLDRVALVNNETTTALHIGVGTMDVAHATIARNESGAFPARSIIVENGDMRIENSILTDSSGAEITGASGAINGKCNLVDLPGELPGGSYFVGNAVFNDNGNDIRQQAHSDGVDACEEDSFVWSNNIDIEYQSLPANESTNPNGFPGENGGIYDAGFDEALLNVGPDDIIFIDGFD